MIYRKLDENGDYVFGRNQNSYLQDASAVNQAVVTRLRQLIYEWWEDLEDGIPVWQKILGNRNKQEAEQIIRERIQKTKYVKSILSFEPTWDNETRTLTIQTSIDTEFGQTDINEVI
jgi:hypothetical protein